MIVEDLVGNTTLMSASLEGHLEVTKLLIEEGVDVNAQDNEGWTALMYASGAGLKDRKDVNPEVVPLLIKAGADVNAQDNKGYTALKWASREGHTDIVKLLKEAGAKE